MVGVKESEVITNRERRSIRHGGCWIVALLAIIMFHALLRHTTVSDERFLSYTLYITLNTTETVAYLLAAFDLLIILRRWSTALRFLGLRSLKSCKLMWRLSKLIEIMPEGPNNAMGSRPVRRSTSRVLFASVLSIVSFLLETRYLYAISAVLVAESLSVTLYALPPAVLFLSHSTGDRLALQLQIMDVVKPLRVVSLLDPKESSSRVITKALGFLSMIRIANGSMWEEVLKELMARVPIIVIDIRGVTAAVATELRLIADRRFVSKTLVVTELGDATTAEIVLKTEETVINLGPIGRSEEQAISLIREVRQKDGRRLELSLLDSGT